MTTRATRAKPKNSYDCTKCPAYCCSIYERVAVTKRDVARLARHFGVSETVATARYTKPYEKERVLRRKKDPVLGTACQFLDPVTRGCTVYEARPRVCRDYPGRRHCAYYDALKFEQEVQGDETVMPLIKLVFRKAPATKSP